MDLIRKMLFVLEAHPPGFFLDKVEILGYTQEQIDYHAWLLGQTGLAEVIETAATGSSSPEALIRSLTWQGHEFLDAARDNTRWNQAKDKVQKIGGATMPVWTALLTEIAKKTIGL